MDGVFENLLKSIDEHYPYVFNLIGDVRNEERKWNIRYERF